MMKHLFRSLLLLSLPWQTLAGGLEPYQSFDEAPGLSLEDIGHEVHTLADYRGQVVLLNFWASWCAPCVIEMPAMQRLQQAMAGKPFSILAVNVAEAPARVWNFAARLGLRFPLLLDPRGQTTSDWQVVVYPTSFLVDPQGRIRYVTYGPRIWDDAETIHIIEQMLEASPGAAGTAG